MKKIILSSALLLAAVAIKAQAPTFNFQTWSSAFSEPQEPKGWITENILASPLLATFGAVPNPNPNPTSVFKDSLGNAHTGYSMKITTVHIQSNPLPGTPPSGLPDTVGIAMTGSVGFVNGSLSLKTGFPMVGRPQNLTFWYKSSPMTGDTCGASVQLWKSVSGVRKMVATGEFRTGATVGTMTQATVTLNYDPIEGWRWSDSASITFGSSYRVGLQHPKIGSTLWVDDLVWGTDLITGISESAAAMPQVSVYPNPATTLVNFETAAAANAEKVCLYDLTGKMVSSELFDNNKARINTSSLSNGLYIYTVTDRDKRVISTQKLNVNR